jgi:pseudouridine-5'-phosphate glycosidase
VDPGEEMDREEHDRILETGLGEAGRRRITGKDVTPFLLGWFHEHSKGASLRANVALVLANADLAARVAAAVAGSAQRAAEKE